MKFDTPATSNPIDQLKVIGKPVVRVDGPLKVTGRAPYAYERHDVVSNPLYGYIVGSAIAKGRIKNLDLAAAKALSWRPAANQTQNGRFRFAARAVLRQITRRRRLPPAWSIRNGRAMVAKGASCCRRKGVG